MKIVRIDTVELAGPHSLRLQFSDGLRKTVDILPLLRGPIFEPLRDPAYFSRVLLDPVAGTVVWPNGADFAPEALHDLPAQEDSDRRSTDQSDQPARGKRRAAERPKR